LQLSTAVITSTEVTTITGGEAKFEYEAGVGFIP